MRDEVDAAAKNVSGFVNPVGVDRRIEALQVTPTRLLIGIGVTKTNVHYIVVSKKLLHCFCDGGLRFFLGKVVCYKSSTTP